MKSEIRVSKPDDVYPCLLERDVNGTVFLMVSEHEGTIVYSVNQDEVGSHSVDWRSDGLSLFDDDVILNNRW